jgi:RNA polymerase sigma-70 factor (ECF subfamily)
MFSGAFWCALAPAIREVVDARAVEARLAMAWAAARARPAACELPPAVLAAYVAERVATVAELDAVLAPEVLAELSLACACARGDERAIQRLEASYFPQVAASLARLRLPGHVVDEALQWLRKHLLLARQDPDRSAGHDGRRGIGGFRGRGALASWLSVSAARAAYKLVDGGRRDHDGDDALARLSSPDGGEGELVKRSSREAFERAFAEALAQLSNREKGLLRLHYLDGVTIDRLGGLYQTHRATAARWLAMARQRLLDLTRAALTRQLRLPLAECDSLIRAAQSRLDLTLHRLFATRS